MSESLNGTNATPPAPVAVPVSGWKAPPSQELQRNREMLQAWEDLAPEGALAEKYGLTINKVRQICRATRDLLREATDTGRDPNELAGSVYSSRSLPDKILRHIARDYLAGLTQGMISLRRGSALLTISKALYKNGITPRRAGRRAGSGIVNWAEARRQVHNGAHPDIINGRWDLPVGWIRAGLALGMGLEAGAPELEGWVVPEIIEAGNGQPESERARAAREAEEAAATAKLRVGGGIFGRR